MAKKTFVILMVLAMLAMMIPSMTGAEELELVGELEGPTIVSDPAQFPTKFNEAPMLAEMVKAGTLPPVEERLPKVDSLMVLKPLDEVGKYGGTWRRGFTGAMDGENGNRIVSSDKPLFWDYTGTKIVPSLVKGYEVSDECKVTTLFLREGLKWSDGQPMTADDWMFWFDDIYGNRDIMPTPLPDMSVNGQPGKMVKVDDYTVKFEFPESYCLFEEILAGSTLLGGGQATRQSRGSVGGAYAPAHYLKQFHPKYVAQEELDKMATEAGFDTWLNFLKFKMDWQLNTELPVVGPWKTTSPINTPTWILERNPYYWTVDTEGNQLPYIDKIVMTLAENTEVLNLRAIAGEYDEQERHTDLTKLPVFLENQEKGNYTVHLDPAFNGSDTTLQVNQCYNADPEIAKWLQNKDFRHALSLGIDRDQMNETFWLGVGTPGSALPSEQLPYNPGPEYRTLWSTYDPDQANQLLDKIGLDKKDGDGFRLRTDGKGRLQVEVVAVGGMFLPYSLQAEMIRDQWRKIGIDATVKELERSVAFGRSANNENQIMIWANDGSELLYLFPRHSLPVDPTEAHMGMCIAKWYATNGAEGTEPYPELKKALELLRSAGSMGPEDRIKNAQEIWKILAEEAISIGTVGQSPAFMGVRVVNNNMGNIPARQVNAQHARTPCTSHPETFFFKELTQ